MHALAAVRREIGSHTPDVRSKYLREFTQAFQGYDSVLYSSELNDKLAQAGILLVGDYHALAASQRFTAELIERQAQHRPVVVGVEAVLSRDQKLLDMWWRREIAEADLRRRLQFDREWGYEWAPLYDLLVSARDHADGIYGLDCMPREDLRRIRSRDRHAAAKICEIRERHPNAVIVVLFGESHLAPQHLPQLLSEALPGQHILTILQNVDALYWKAVEERAESVNVDNRTVCIFNSSPIEKYESYRLCLEKWNTAADDQPDFAPPVYNVIFSLARSLGFRTDSPKNGRQPKFLADLLPEVICVNHSDEPSLGENERTRLENGGCVYSPATNSFLIREFQMEFVAEEATRFLYLACQVTKESTVSCQQIEAALAQFGSKLLCPTNSDGTGDCALGQALYVAYLEGRITKAAIRRIFMAHVKDREQAAELISKAAVRRNSD
jgi:Haem-binding uptake, Tiki superfamily, ChaN